jgi:hypothetical protein
MSNYISDYMYDRRPRVKNFKTNIKQKYNMSNYQVEQIVFVFKSVGSELSKMLIMGILLKYKGKNDAK